MSMGGKDTIESLTKEATWLKEKLAGVEKKLEEKKRLLGLFELAEPYTPKKTFTVEWRPLTPTTVSTKGEGKRVLEDLVGLGKRRKKVGKTFDPEVERILGPVVGVNLKVGGVEWGIGIEVVLAGLEVVGCVSCEDSRWLVRNDELERRKAKGKTSSTVVAMVRGEKEVGALYRQGLWLAGRWHSVKRYVAVRPMRKVAGWERAIRVIGAKENEGKTMVSGVDGSLREMRSWMEGQLGGIRSLLVDRRSGPGVVGRSSGGFGGESFQERADREMEEFKEERERRRRAKEMGGSFGSGDFSFSGLVGGSGRGKVWDGKGKKPSWV